MMCMRVIQRLGISEKIFLSVMSHNADAIYVLDTSYHVLYVNNAFEKLFGWKADEILGRKLPVFSESGIDEFESLLDRVQSGEKFLGIEMRRKKKDGTLIEVSLSVSPMHDDRGEIIAFSCISRDITERKEIEEMVRESEKNKALGELSAGIAHEIRNPLTVIKGFVQLFREESKNEVFCNLILSELERINMILEELLFLGKTHKDEYQVKNVIEIINDVTSLLQAHANLLNINILLDMDAEATYLLCSEIKLKQVFINILKNALEASRYANVVKIKVKRMVSNNLVSLRFIDQGKGMSKETKKQLGKPFFTTKETGTGLGLMISQKIICDHGGSLAIKSKGNFGTVIEVRLPYIKQNDYLSSLK